VNQTARLATVAEDLHYEVDTYVQEWLPCGKWLQESKWKWNMVCLP